MTLLSVIETICYNYYFIYFPSLCLVDIEYVYRRDKLLIYANLTKK